MLGMAITSFLIGVGTYLGCAMTANLNLGSGGSSEESNRGILIAFVVIISFILTLFGQLLGGKDTEDLRCRQNMDLFLHQNRQSVPNAPVNFMVPEPSATNQNEEQGSSRKGTEINAKVELRKALERAVEALQDYTTRKQK
jgi:hypothetical protein